MSFSPSILKLLVLQNKFYPIILGARGVDNRYNFANKVKVDVDGSLKSNDFSQEGEYFMLKV